MSITIQQLLQLLIATTTCTLSQWTLLVLRHTIRFLASLLQSNQNFTVQQSVLLFHHYGRARINREHVMRYHTDGTLIITSLSIWGCTTNMMVGGNHSSGNKSSITTLASSSSGATGQLLKGDAPSSSPRTRHEMSTEL